MLAEPMTQRLGRRDAPGLGLAVETAVNGLAGTLVRQGGKHRRHERNCQDHALALQGPHGVVLAVADGVSSIPRNGARIPTHAEVGAYLVAEVAARAAFATLTADSEPTKVKEAAASALAGVVGPLWRRLGGEAPMGLYSTLVLAVATARWTWAWAAGDGAWGVVLPPGSAPIIADADADGLLTFSEGTSRRGGRNFNALNDCVAYRASQGEQAVGVLLEPVLRVSRPAIALWVATDGLRDELGVAERLRRPVRRPQDLSEALRRHPDSDDVAIAFAVRGGAP